MGRVPIPCAGPSRHNPQGSKLPVNRQEAQLHLPGEEGPLENQEADVRTPTPHSALGNRIPAKQEGRD